MKRNLVICLVACFLAAAVCSRGGPAAAGQSAANKPAGEILAAKKPADTKTATKKPDDTKADAKTKPACMHCGATCGLEPICVCEPGTKKQPRTEFETSSEPICIPACGSLPWPCGGRTGRAGCTTCCDEPCACRGRVRACKKLDKKTVDEEVPTVVRQVRSVCAGCAGRGTAGCCGVEVQRPSPAWWATLTWWWPR